MPQSITTHRLRERLALLLSICACQSPVEGSGGGLTEANTETTSTPDTLSSPDESEGSTGTTGETLSATNGASSSESSGSGTTTGNAPLSCGNAVVDPGEACDDGSDPNQDKYNGEDQPCTSGCELAVCGDKMVLAPSEDSPGEECDEGENNAEGYGNCTTECMIAPNCGDGDLQPAYELCDCGGELIENGTCVDSKDIGKGVRCIAATCRYAAKLVFLANPEDPFVDWNGSFSFAGHTAGIESADWLCDSLAAEAGLFPHAAEREHTTPRFRAWLSTAGSPVNTRFTTYENLPYAQRSGDRVAISWSDLIEYGPASPIIWTQNHNVKITQASVWSNTTMDGSAKSNVYNCVNWTVSALDPKGNAGYNGTPDDPASWTDSPAFSHMPCNEVMRLYCFEQ